MAERLAQAEIGDATTIYVRPVFDKRYRGLLSGQSLMLDLQRMEYDVLENGGAILAQANATFSLANLSAPQLRSLKTTGRTMFTLRDKDLDLRAPDEYERRIKSMRVRLPGVEGSNGPVTAKLSLVDHRIYHDKTKSKERSSRLLVNRQQIALQSAETNTENLTTASGKFKPFERCGVESTWALSFPAAVKAIQSRLNKFDEKEALEKLRDVVLDVTYTYKL